MLIVIDVGNTNIVFGFFLKGKFILERRISSQAPNTEDELFIFLQQFLDQIKISTDEIQSAVIASVIPEVTIRFQKMFKRYLKVSPLVIDGTLDIGVKIPYSNPSKLGADRICSVVATIKKFGGPTIVVDFGTATTYDVISSKDEYLGGVISPGIETSAAELFRRTAKLPKTDLLFPPSVIGTNTTEAIQSGVMYGAVDAFEGMIRRLRRIAGKYAMVVATGGYAPLIADMTTEIKYMEPTLVLEGARLIFEMVSKKEKK